MPCAVIVTCLFYGAISGSAPATVAAVGKYDNSDLSSFWDMTESFSTAIVAVAGGSWSYHTAKYPIYHVWYGIWGICKVICLWQELYQDY